MNTLKTCSFGQFVNAILRSGARHARWLALGIMVGGLLSPQPGIAGTWTPVANQAPDNIDTMLLLSDGTVMAFSGEPISGNIGNAVYRLTPDIHGSYANGTWSTLAPMNDTRLYYASQVLQDGRVFVAGGEYGTGTPNAEIYDPNSNFWTRLPSSGQQFIDCESRTLPNGNVLVSPVFPSPLGTTIMYNPKLNTWLPAGKLVRGINQDEASYIKLPDDSILCPDSPGTGTNCERYIPSQNQWIDDATMPGSPWDFAKFEMGAGFLCADGRGFYLGSSGTNLFYTPSGGTAPGTWALATNCPAGLGTADAPGAMLVTGNILCALGPDGYVGGSSNYPGPTAYFEFNPIANAFIPEPTPAGIADPNPPYIDRMLDLPDGTVMFSDSSTQLYIYSPAGQPLAAGKPTINSVIASTNGNYQLTGTLLNGISEGAQYGDDAQMDSNYPLIRITDANGHVYYVRTFNWSSTSVMTGNTPMSVNFSLPAGVPAGTYSLVVIANGISSDPVVFNGVATPDLIEISDTVTGGNGNGVIDFDECNSLFLVLTNVGAANATTVRATLSTTTPGVVVAQSTATYPNVPIGAAATNLNPFEISTTPDFVCGTPISFTLVVKSDQNSSVDIFTIGTGTPGLPIEFDNSFPVTITSTAQGVSSTINVTNITSALMHVSVSAFVFESFDFDLTLQLIGPDGTTVNLSQNNGGAGQDYGAGCTNGNETVFDDTASVSINAGVVPFIGTFQPDSPLAVFTGKSGTNINGSWQLRAVDPTFGDVGIIECWSLFLTPATCTDGGGQCPGIDLALGMIAQPNPVIRGSNLTYTLSVTNFGPDTATSVAVSQILPPGVTFVSAAASQGGASQSGGLVTANLGTMVVGATATVTVVVTPNTPGLIFSSASVGALQQDLNEANNSASVTTLVSTPTADLAVSLTAAPNPVLLDGVLTYTASVVNNGPSIATNTVVTNTLPLNVSVLSSSATQGVTSVSANQVIANLGSLPVGSNAIVTIQVAPLVLGVISASSHVSSDVSDPNPLNNTSSVSVSVAPAADLALTLTGPSSVIIGSNLTYQINVENLGPSPATGVEIRDTLPSGALKVQASSPNGVLATNGNSVSCLVSNLAVGSNASLTITIGTSNLSGNVVDTASVSSQQADPNTANNSASLATLVTSPTLTIVPAGFLLESESSFPTNGMIDSGETVTMLLRLQNLGNINSAGNLTATLLSTGGVIPANGSQVQNYGALDANGPAVGEPFTFSNSATNGGKITASLQIKNNGTNFSVVNFVFNIPASNSVANPANIIIPDHGPGSIYPSIDTVSGLTGVIGSVAVVLTNVNHTFPDDVDMLLVGPGGQTTLLMSHSGFNGVLTNTSLTFDQGATNAQGLPQFLPPSSQITSGTYRPSAYGSVNFTNTFGGTIVVNPKIPPPQQPYGTNLAIYNGTNPNGQWLLYVFDSSVGDDGIIIGGWSLVIDSGSGINPIADLAITGNGTPNPDLQGNNIIYTYTITNNGPNPSSVVQFTNSLPANAVFVSATNSAHVAVGLDGNGNVVSTLTNLNSGSNVVITIVLTPAGSGAFTNTATVSGSESDPNQSNNSASVVTTVTPQISDLSLTMTENTNAALIGADVVYTITVTNNGPDNALNIVVTDPLQGVLQLQGGSSTGSGGSPFLSGPAAVCNVGNLAPGASATISLLLTSSNINTVTNTATVTSVSTDNDLTNNSDSVVTMFTPLEPDIVAAGARLLSSLPNGTLVAGQPATVSLQLANIGSADTTNLVATLLATNGVLSPGAPVNFGTLTHGGPAVGKTFSFTASGAGGGAVIATLQLSNNGTVLPPVTFTFTLPATNTFANTNYIIIPDHGAGTPYPAGISISNVTGLIIKTTVTLTNFTHQFPNDVQVLLTSPSGKSVVLLAGVGGGLSVTNTILTFDDSASATLPSSSTEFVVGAGRIISGTYQPTDDGLALPFPGPAPAPPYGPVLGTLNGGNPNGTWQLYVFDNSPGDDGNIAGGWSLNLSTVSPVDNAADLALGLAVQPGSIFSANPFALNFSVTNQGPANAANVTVANTLSAGLSFVSTSTGTVSNSGALVSVNLGTLDSGGATNFTLLVQAASPGGYLDSAIVSSDQTDLNPLNNSAQVQFQVSSAPKLTATAVITNSALALNLSINGPNGVYSIFASTNINLNFAQWTLIATVTNTTGKVLFSDTNTANVPLRFYQAVLAP